MSQYKYCYQGKQDASARNVGVGLPISTKQAIEICNVLRGMRLAKAIQRLEDVIEKKVAIPYRRFTDGVGHRKGMASGRYPLKASTEILQVLKTVEANAQYVGLNVESLIIKHINAQKASRPWHYGRQRRRQTKRTHVEVVVEEFEKKARTQKDVPKKKVVPGPKQDSKKPSETVPKEQIEETKSKPEEKVIKPSVKAPRAKEDLTMKKTNVKTGGKDD